MMDDWKETIGMFIVMICLCFACIIACIEIGLDNSSEDTDALDIDYVTTIDEKEYYFTKVYSIVDVRGTLAKILNKGGIVLEIEFAKEYGGIYWYKEVS